MKRFVDAVLALLMTTAALLGAPSGALACAVCYGRPGDPMVEGANAGVLFLLVVIAAVLAWFVGVIIYIARRSRRVAMERGEI